MHDSVAPEIKALNKLPDSGRLYKAVVESVFDATGILDEHANVVYQSDASKQILGYGHGERIGKNAFELMHPDDVPKIRQFFTDIVKTKDLSGKSEFRYKHQNGAWIYLEAFVINLLHDESVNGIVFSYRDISQRKQLEQTIKDREELFETILENAYEGIGIIGEDGKTKYRSPSFEKIVGYSMEERLENNILELVHPEDIPEVEKVKQQLLDNPGEKIRSVIRFKHKNERWLFLETVAVNLLDNPVINGIVINYRDITEQIIAEEKNRAILDGVPDMIFHLSRNGKYLGFSPGKNTEPYEPPEKLMGNNIKDVLPGEITDLYMHAIKEAITSKQVQLIEYSLGDWKDKNKFIYFESRIIAIGNDEVVAMVRDVTERKNSEEALKRSEQRNRALLNGVPEIIFQVDKKGTFLDYKPGNNFEPLAPPEKFLGAKINDILPRPIAKTAMRLIGKALKEKGMVQSFEYSLPDTERGRLNYFESRLIASSEDEVIVLVSDITQRKESEIALLKSEERWRSMVENAPNFIAILDHDQRITFINGFNGLDPNTMLGLKAWQTVDKKYQQGLKEAINRVIETGSMENVESSATDTNGKKKWWSATYAPLKIPEDPSKVIVMAFDITDQKHAEKQLKISNQKLKRLNHRLETIREEEKKTMAMEIHDELGQELTAIKLGMFWIQQYLEENSSTPGLKVLQDKTTMLIDLCSQTINSVRRIAHQLRPVVLDNLGLIPAIEWHVNSLNKNSDIKHVFYSNTEEVVFNKDFSTALFRVIQESLTNISRHSRATEAHINLYKTADELILLIIDNGIGIKKNATNQPGKIGIFGIKERIKNWKGKFSIKGINHKGTTLKISFPLKGSTIKYMEIR